MAPSRRCLTQALAVTPSVPGTGGQIAPRRGSGLMRQTNRTSRVGGAGGWGEPGRRSRLRDVVAFGEGGRHSEVMGVAWLWPARRGRGGWWADSSGDRGGPPDASEGRRGAGRGGRARPSGALRGQAGPRRGAPAGAAIGSSPIRARSILESRCGSHGPTCRDRPPSGGARSRARSAPRARTGPPGGLAGEAQRVSPAPDRRAHRLRQRPEVVVPGAVEQVGLHPAGVITGRRGQGEQSDGTANRQSGPGRAAVRPYRQGACRRARVRPCGAPSDDCP